MPRAAVREGARTISDAVKGIGASGKVMEPGSSNNGGAGARVAAAVAAAASAAEADTPPDAPPPDVVGPLDATRWLGTRRPLFICWYLRLWYTCMGTGTLNFRRSQHMHLQAIVVCATTTSSTAGKRWATITHVAQFLQVLVHLLLCAFHDGPHVGLNAQHVLLQPSPQSGQHIQNVRLWV